MYSRLRPYDTLARISRSYRCYRYYIRDVSSRHRRLPLALALLQRVRLVPPYGRHIPEDRHVPAFLQWDFIGKPDWQQNNVRAAFIGMGYVNRPGADSSNGVSTKQVWTLDKSPAPT